MKREYEDTIDLGAVSTDTKGLPVGAADTEFSHQKPIGLSDD